MTIQYNLKTILTIIVFILIGSTSIYAAPICQYCTSESGSKECNNLGVNSGNTVVYSAQEHPGWPLKVFRVNGSNTTQPTSQKPITSTFSDTVYAEFGEGVQVTLSVCGSLPTGVSWNDIRLYAASGTSNNYYECPQLSPGGSSFSCKVSNVNQFKLGVESIFGTRAQNFTTLLTQPGASCPGNPDTAYNPLNVTASGSSITVPVIFAENNVIAVNGGMLAIGGSPTTLPKKYCSDKANENPNAYMSPDKQFINIINRYNSKSNPTPLSSDITIYNNGTNRSPYISQGNERPAVRTGSVSSVSKYIEYKKSIGYNPLGTVSNPQWTNFKLNAVNLLSGKGILVLNDSNTSIQTLQKDSNNTISPRILVVDGDVVIEQDIVNSVPLAIMATGTISIKEGVTTIAAVLISDQNINLEGFNGPSGVTIIGNLVSTLGKINVTRHTANVCRPAVMVQVNQSLYQALMPLLGVRSYTMTYGN